MKIYTIGHSSVSFVEFCEMLKSFNVQKLVDVRSYPGSKFVPHFNKEALASALKSNGIGYVHLPKLGGRRKSCKKEDSALVEGWKNKAFQNYASYTLTAEYEDGLAELISQAKSQTVAIMCAESVPWKCHRLIISNSLATKEISVFHIIKQNLCIKHELNKYGAYAEIQNGKLIYPCCQK